MPRHRFVDTRDRIESAAIHLFVEKSVDGTTVRDVIVAGMRAGDLPEQDPDLATALVLGVVLQPVTFSAYGRLPATLGPIAERLVAAAWNVVATI